MSDFWKGWGIKSQGKELLAFRKFRSAEITGSYYGFRSWSHCKLFPVERLCQLAFRQYHTSIQHRMFSFKKKKFFFSISRATRNCQRRYLSYNKRMKYSMKNMGKFRSNLISMWGKQKQVLFVWKGTSCFFLNVPFSLAFRLFFLSCTFLSLLPLSILHFNS